jgi:hypothetical protein
VKTHRIHISSPRRAIGTLSAAAALLLAGAPSAPSAADDANAAVQRPAPASPAQPPPDAAPIAPTRPLRVTLSMSGYTDKGGVFSVEPRLVGTIPAPFQSELRVGSSYTDAGLQLAAPTTTRAGAPAAGRSGGTITSTAPGRSMVGASLTVPWSIVRATAGYALFLDSQSTLQDREIAVAVKPIPALELSGALRQRPFVEMAEPLAVDEQPFYTAGPAGATDVLAAWPLTVDEVRLIGKISPTSWAYLYGDARRMAISDGNHGWTASAGAGASMASLFGLRSPVDVTLRWDTWAASYAAVSAVYYSPPSVVSHSPGLEVRLRQPSFELAAEGGETFAPGQSFTGVFYGGSAVLRLGRVSMVARAQSRSDPWFASRKAWVALQSEF